MPAILSVAQRLKSTELVSSYLAGSAPGTDTRHTLWGCTEERMDCAGEKPARLNVAAASAFHHGKSDRSVAVCWQWSRL